MPLAAPVEPLDPDLVEACGATPNTVCEAVWDWTGNERITVIADWFIGKPLAIVLILLVALIGSKLVRRAVRRTVYRVMVTDRQSAARALQRMTPVAGASSADPASELDAPRRIARANSISQVVASSVSVIIWVLALLLVLGELDIDLAPLIAGAGIAGVALGFGAQSIVKDCLTGLFMLIEDQFGIGDVVDLGEAAGTVERISLRATVLRGLDGTVWHVPNGEVVRVGNRSQLWSVAVIDVVVGYAADVQQASQIFEQTAAELVLQEEYARDVLAAPELLGVESTSADGVLLRLTIKTTAGEQFRLQRALREAVKQAFDAADIPAPHPRSMWPPGRP